jgi:O-antigen ligase
VRLSTRSLMTAAAVGLALGSLGRIPGVEILGKAGAVTLLDLTLLPLWLLLVVSLVRQKRRWPLDGFARAWLAFVAVAALSTLLAGPKWDLSLGQHLGVAAFLLRWIAYAGFYLLIATDPDPDTAGREAWRRIERAVLVILALGVVQVIFLPSLGATLMRLTGMVWDDQGRRLVSTVLDPNFAGTLFALVLLMRLAREAEGLHTDRRVLVALLAGIVLTLSRSTWIALAATCALLVWWRGWRGSLRRIALGGGLLLLPVLPLVIAFGSAFNKFSVDASALLRLVAWLRSGILLRDNPLLGVGFNAAGPAQRAYGWETIGGGVTSLDGGLMFVAVLTGLLGLAAYCAMLGVFLAAARRTWRAPEVPPERRAFAVGAALGTILVLVQSLFTNTLLNTLVMLPLWVLQARVVATAPAPLRAGLLAALGARFRANVRRARARNASRDGARDGAQVVARRVAGASVLVLALGLAGCDPCAGVAACRTTSTRAVTGTIVDAVTSAPVSGVRVALGAQSTVTDADGRWVLERSGATDTAVTLQVQRPGLPAYDVPNVALRASRTAGEARDLGLWWDRPVLQYVLGVLVRGVKLDNVPVTFTVDSALGGGQFQSTIFDGFTLLRGPAPAAGPLRGTLRVTASGMGTRDIAGVEVVADHEVRVPEIRRVIELRRRFGYGGRVVNRGTGAATPGAIVTFTRTGGLMTTPAVVVDTAGPDGMAFLDLEFHGFGETRGTLRIQPPAGAGLPSTYADFRLQTFDTPEVRNLGVFQHGERWTYRTTLVSATDGAPIPWMPYTFVRDSGVAITPNTYSFYTNFDGTLWLHSPMLDSGTVRGTLTLFPPGRPPVPMGVYRLRTAPADTLLRLPTLSTPWP